MLSRNARATMRAMNLIHRHARIRSELGNHCTTKTQRYFPDAPDLVTNGPVSRSFALPPTRVKAVWQPIREPNHSVDSDSQVTTVYVHHQSGRRYLKLTWQGWSHDLAHVAGAQPFVVVLGANAASRQPSVTQIGHRKDGTDLGFWLHQASTLMTDAIDLIMMAYSGLAQPTLSWSCANVSNINALGLSRP